MAAVADRHLHGEASLDDAVMLDVGAERTHGDEEAQRRDRIAEDAPFPFRFGGEGARQLGAEADAGDVEEGAAVDLAEIDPPGVAGDDQARGRDRIRFDAEGSRKIVGRAERQDAERQPGLDDGRGGGVQGAVAAADDDAMEASGLGADDLGNGTLRAAFLLDHVDAAAAQHAQDVIQGCGTASGVTVDEKQRAAPRGRGRARLGARPNPIFDAAVHAKPSKVCAPGNG
jgi:hypothetical protein